jgi:hypothetical protein
MSLMSSRLQERVWLSKSLLTLSVMNSFLTHEGRIIYFQRCLVYRVSCLFHYMSCVEVNSSCNAPVEDMYRSLRVTVGSKVTFLIWACLLVTCEWNGYQW